MDKLTAIKIKYDDGTYSDEIPVSVLSENVEWDNTHTLVDVLGSIDVDVTGTIQDQISQLFNEKVTYAAMTDYVGNSMNTYITDWLNTNVNPVGSAVMVDKSLTIDGAASDAKIVGDNNIIHNQILGVLYNKYIHVLRRWTAIPFSFEVGKTYYINLFNFSKQVSQIRIQNKKNLDSSSVIKSFPIYDINKSITYTCESTEALYLIILCDASVTEFDGYIYINNVENFTQMNEEIDSIKEENSQLLTITNEIQNKACILENIFFQNKTPIITQKNNSTYFIDFFINSANLTMFSYYWESNQYHIIYISPVEYGELIAEKTYRFTLSDGDFLCFDMEISHPQIQVKSYQNLNQTDIILAYVYQSDTISRIKGVIPDYLQLYKNDNNSLFNKSLKELGLEQMSINKNVFSRFSATQIDFQKNKTYLIKIENVSENPSTIRIASKPTINVEDIIKQWSVTQLPMEIIYTAKQDGGYLQIICPASVSSFVFSLTVLDISFNSNILEEITNINTELESIKEIPDYAVNYLDTKIDDTFKTILTNNKNSDSFIFYTDTHFPSNAGQTGKYISYIIEKTPIENVFFGGDVCPAYASSYPNSTSEEACQKSIIEQFENINGKIKNNGHLFQTKGNHDFHVSSQTDLSDKYMRNPQEAKNIIINGSDKYNIVIDNNNLQACYYYVDNPSQKIRYIILDSCEEFGRNNEQIQTYGITDKQFQWIAENAIKTAKDYNYIFINHVSITNLTSTGEYRNFTNLKSFIDAIQSHTTVTINNIQYSFSDITGKILLVLTGHEHEDLMTYNNGILHASIACDATYGDYKKSFIYQHFNAIPPTKTKGTIYETTFDIVNIDGGNEKINFIRVGGGGNRYFNLKEEKINIDSTKQLTPSISGNIEWWCYDSDKASVSSDYIIIPEETYASISNTGVITGLTSGNSVAVAKNENDEYEFFNIIIN